MKTALLLSGGLDSTSLASWIRPDLAITINYGQRAADAEIRASIQVCRDLEIPHEIITANCSEIGLGCMSDRQREYHSELSTTQEWWPFRNQLIITIAAARAVVLGARILAIGSVATDVRHKDGTPEFVETMSRLLQLQEGTLRLLAPALGMSTVELIVRSGIPASILAWCHSCHIAPFSCGECPGCVKNKETWDALTNLPTFRNHISNSGNG